MTRLLMKVSLSSSNEVLIIKKRVVLSWTYIRTGGNFSMGDSEVKPKEELNKKILDKEKVEQLIKDAVNTALEENFSLYFAKAAKLSLAEDLLYLRNAVDQLVAPLKTNVDDLKKTLEENHLRDVNELRIKQKQLDDKEAELYIAKEEATNLQNQLAMQETEMGRKKEKIKNLELQVDELKQKLADKKAEAEKLSAQLSTSEEKAEGLEKKLSDSEEKAEKLSTDLRTSEAKGKELEAKLFDSKAEAEKLSTELSASEEKAQGLEQELSDSKAEAAKLSNDLSASEEKAEGLEQELSDSKAEAAKLSTQLSTSEAKAQGLERELAKVDALLQPYHEIYKAFVACPVFKDVLSQRGINDEEKSSMLKLAEVLGESYTIAGDMYEQIKSAKKENKEPLTHEEGIVYSLLNKYYREHNNIEVDIFTLPGEQNFEQDFVKTDFNKNEQEDLTDPSGAKNRKFAAKVYVPRFNRDNGNMMKKAIVEASNI
jgi:chromosome segregation ATPase